MSSRSGADAFACELREREERHLRHESRSSPQAMASLLADDFIEFGSSGRISLDRAAVIEAVSREEPFAFRIEDFRARVLAAQVALTTYRLFTWTDAEDRARVTLRSSIWAHRAGRWQLVFHQGTVCSAAARTE